MEQVQIGIIGGSGLYDMAEVTDRRDITLSTPFGAPSGPYVIGTLRGRDPAAAAAELERELDASLAQRTFGYVRSDGSEQRLTLRDVVARAPALEMAYNPNDCVEVRWGAVEGTAEMATCRRRAPDEQRARMAKYRGWFSTRTRPPQ